MMLCDFWGGVDLNTKWHDLPPFRALARRSLPCTPGKTLFAQLMGLPAVDNIFSHRQALSRRPLRQGAFVFAAFSSDGICSTGLPREFARHRSFCLAAQSSKLYHMGFKAAGQACHTRRRQRGSENWRHLCRLRPTADHTKHEDSIPTHPLDIDWDGNGLRARFDHHRSLPVALSLGPISNHQIGRQRFIRCSICKGTYPALSISPTASGTMSTYSISC